MLSKSNPRSFYFRIILVCKVRNRNWDLTLFFNFLRCNGMVRLKLFYGINLRFKWAKVNLRSSKKNENESVSKGSGLEPMHGWVYVLVALWCLSYQLPHVSFHSFVHPTCLFFDRIFRFLLDLLGPFLNFSVLFWNHVGPFWYSRSSLLFQYIINVKSYF